MNPKEFEDLQQAYSAALQKMFNTPHTFRLQTEPQNDGSHHIEIIDGEYNLVATERGIELERKKTNDPDEILYWLVSHTAFWKGVEHEFRNRIEEHDCRRIIFPKQMELLGLVDQNWAERCGREIAEILAEHPYTDRRQ